MSGTVDIVGYTLAETALVLVFVLIVVYAPESRKVQKLQGELQTTRHDLDAALEKQAREQEHPRPIQRKVIDRTALRSAAPPSCVETGVATGWLFTATVEGRDSYRINGVKLTFDELQQRYQTNVTEARDAGCFHRVKVYFTPSITSVEYDEALRKLEELFYTRKLGVER